MRGAGGGQGVRVHVLGPRPLQRPQSLPGHVWGGRGLTRPEAPVSSPPGSEAPHFGANPRGQRTGLHPPHSVGPRRSLGFRTWHLAPGNGGEWIGVQDPLHPSHCHRSLAALGTRRGQAEGGSAQGGTAGSAPGSSGHTPGVGTAARGAGPGGGVSASLTPACLPAARCQRGACWSTACSAPTSGTTPWCSRSWSSRRRPSTRWSCTVRASASGRGRVGRAVSCGPSAPPPAGRPTPARAALRGPPRLPAPRRPHAPGQPGGPEPLRPLEPGPGLPLPAAGPPAPRP